MAQEIKRFGPEQEKAIISLIFDEPDFFANIVQYLKPDHFIEFATKYVYTLIHLHHEKHQVIISRELCRDEIMYQLSTDDDYEPILEVIDRPSDQREMPIIRSLLVEWAKERAYAELYSEETYDAYERGEYKKIDEIIEKAGRITDASMRGLWFFDQIDLLFDENAEQKLTCGFPRLDSVINEGGPTHGDVFCWVAPTGVGKSILLVNSAVANIRKFGSTVVHVTLELSDLKTSLRYMGVITELPIKRRAAMRDKIESNLIKFRNSYGGNLLVYEFPPDDISIDTLYALLESIRSQHGIGPDVVVIDYLELMLSKVSGYNTTGDDYSRQKRVATEIRQFAKKENVLVFTASQTNRSGTGNDDKPIGLNKVAESFGKTMPLDYIVTINQTEDDYNKGRENRDDDNSSINSYLRFYVAKNRNGPKFTTIGARVNYDTMKVREYEGS